MVKVVGRTSQQFPASSSNTPSIRQPRASTEEIRPKDANLATSTAPRTASVPPGKGDLAHYHSQWDLASPYHDLEGKSASHFEKLADGWVEQNRAAKARSNVDHNLWRTAGRSNYDVLRNAGVLEVPVSMLEHSSVEFHLRGEVDRLIEGVPDPELKGMLQDLYHHPARDVLVSQTEVLRLILAACYSKKQDPECTEANVFVDIDSIELANYKAAVKQLGDKATYDPLEQSRQIITAAANSLKSSPAETGENSVSIPKSLKQRGWGKNRGETDVILAIPHHPKAIERVNYMHTLLVKGKLPDGIKDSGLKNDHYLLDKYIPPFLDKYNLLRETLGLNLTTQHAAAIDLYRLAERVRLAFPKVIERLHEIDEYIENHQNEPNAQSAVEELKKDISVLMFMYKALAGYILEFSNLHTYLPLCAGKLDTKGSTAHRANEKFMSDALGASPLGKEKFIAEHGSWRAKGLEYFSAKYPEARFSSFQELDDRKKEVFRTEILGMDADGRFPQAKDGFPDLSRAILRARTTEDVLSPSEKRTLHSAPF